VKRPWRISSSHINLSATTRAAPRESPAILEHSRRMTPGGLSCDILYYRNDREVRFEDLERRNFLWIIPIK
jgi:hypothetical protein